MRTPAIALGITALAAGLMAGCNPAVPTDGGNGNGVLDNVNVDFNLGTGLGDFEVEAGVPKTLVGTGRFSLTGATASGGVFILDPSDVTVIPGDTSGGKGAADLQTGDPLQITVLIDGIEDVDTVCTDGEQYGPYSITLDENNVPVSIDPSEINLTANTIALLNSGEFSICIAVLSPVSGTVRIATLTFSVVPSLE